MSLVQMKEVSAGLSAEIRAMIDWKGLLEALFPVGCNFDFTWFAVDLPSTVNQVNYTLENATTQLQNFLASVKDDVKQIDFSKYTTTAKGAFTLLPVILNDSSFGDFTIANFGAFLDLMYYVDTLCSTPSDLEDLVASDLHHPKINISTAYCTARSAGTLATFTGSCIEVIPDNEAASTRLLGGGVHYKTERRVVNRRYIRWIQKAASSSARTEGLQNVLGSSSGANPTAMTSEMRKAIAFTKRAKFLNENVHRIPECEHFGVDLLAELMKCQEAKSLVNGAYIKMGGVFHVIPFELMVPSHDYAAQTQQRRTLMHATSIQTANLGGFELPVERPRKHPSIDFSDLPAMLTRWARGHQCLELAEWEPLYEYVSFFRVWSERFASMPHLHKYLVDLDGGFFRQGLHSDTLAGTPFGTSLISMNEKVKKEGDERAKHIMLLYRDSQPIPNELQFRSSGQGKGRGKGFFSSWTARDSPYGKSSKKGSKQDSWNKGSNSENGGKKGKAKGADLPPPPEPFIELRGTCYNYHLFGTPCAQNPCNFPHKCPYPGCGQEHSMREHHADWVRAHLASQGKSF